jgi:hypothetical protein
MARTPGITNDPGGSIPLAGFDLFGFDAALARGPIDFPFPRRYGPGSGASEFVEATIATSDPAIDPSASNHRRIAIHRRPGGKHRVRV